MALRRGSIFDLASVLLTLTFAVILFFTLATWWNDFNPSIVNTLNQSGYYQQTAQDAFSGVNTSFDVFLQLIPWLTIMAGLSAVVLAWFIPTHPVFLPVGIIAYVMLVGLSAIFADVNYSFLMNNAAFTALANNYPLTVELVRNLPLVVGALGMLILIVQYARQPGGQSA